MTNKKILIVDDDRADRFLLKRTLKKAGLEAEIDECFDGSLALDYFDSIQPESVPDLVLLDINMPKVDGIEFLQRYDEMLARQPEKEVPVIVMLTSVSRSDEEKCLSYNFVAGQATKLHDQTDRLLQQIHQILEG